MAVGEYVTTSSTLATVEPLVLALGLPGIAAAQAAAETQGTATGEDLPPRVGITSEAVSLTLDEVVALALEHNTEIAVARLQRDVTALGSRAARGAFDDSIYADSYFERNVTPSTWSRPKRRWPRSSSA